MKRLIFTLLLVFAVMVAGCGGGKAGKEPGATDKTVDTTLSTESASDEDDRKSGPEATDDARLAEVDEDDPFSELIVQYTPAQLKKIIGKAEPKDVIDLFLLLPIPISCSISTLRGATERDVERRNNSVC